jgi:peroxiredoxin
MKYPSAKQTPNVSSRLCGRNDNGHGYSMCPLTQNYYHMKTRLAFLVVIVGLVTSTITKAQSDQPMIGQTATSFKLPGLDGKTYSLEQFRGQYVVIHFAATWCPFCNAEAPHLEQLFKDYKQKGVQVFIVDVKEGRELVTKLQQKFNFSFPILLDEDGAVSARYAPEGVQPDLARDEVPLASNLIIDKEGNIQFYSLLNTTAFDAKLLKVKQKLDALLATP